MMSIPLLLVRLASYQVSLRLLDTPSVISTSTCAAFGRCPIANTLRTTLKTTSATYSIYILSYTRENGTYIVFV